MVPVVLTVPVVLVVRTARVVPGRPDRAGWCRSSRPCWWCRSSRACRCPAVRIARARVVPSGAPGTQASAPGVVPTAAPAVAVRTVRAGSDRTVPGGSRPDRGGADRRPPEGARRVEDKAPRRVEPALPADVTGDELDRQVRGELGTLSRDNAIDRRASPGDGRPADGRGPRAGLRARRRGAAPGRPGRARPRGRGAGRLPGRSLRRRAARAAHRPPPDRVVRAPAGDGRLRARARPAGARARPGVVARGEQRSTGPVSSRCSSSPPVRVATSASTTPPW